MADGEKTNWRCRDRTQLFKEEIIIGGSVTAQQFKLFLGDVVRVSAEITADVNYSAYNLFQEIMSKPETNKFEFHNKMKKKGFVLQRIVKESDMTYLLFDVNEESLVKLEAAIKDGSLGHLLLSSMTGEEDGNKIDDLELKLDQDDVKTARNNLKNIEKQSKKLHDVYRRRTKLKRTRSVDVEVEDDNPTFSSKKQKTPRGKENARGVKMMGENSLGNRPPSRPVLENLANKE